MRIRFLSFPLKIPIPQTDFNLPGSRYRRLRVLCISAMRINGRSCFINSSLISNLDRSPFANHLFVHRENRFNIPSIPSLLARRNKRISAHAGRRHAEQNARRCAVRVASRVDPPFRHRRSLPRRKTRPINDESYSLRPLASFTPLTILSVSLPEWKGGPLAMAFTQCSTAQIFLPLHIQLDSPFAFLCACSAFLLPLFPAPALSLSLVLPSRDKEDPSGHPFRFATYSPLASFHRFFILPFAFLVYFSFLFISLSYRCHPVGRRRYQSRNMPFSTLPVDLCSYRSVGRLGIVWNYCIK